MKNKRFFPKEILEDFQGFVQKITSMNTPAAFYNCIEGFLDISSLASNKKNYFELNGKNFKGLGTKIDRAIASADASLRAVKEKPIRYNSFQVAEAVFSLISLVNSSYAVPNLIRAELPTAVDESNPLKTFAEILQKSYEYADELISNKLVHYLNRTHRTYNKLQFLDKELPHNRVYVNLPLYQFIKNEKRYAANDIAWLLYNPEPCVIIGNAGAGKSTAARSLLLNASEITDRIKHVPFFAELRRLSKELDSGKSFRDYIIEGTGLSNNALDYMKEEGIKLLLIFDGMDEVYNLDALDNIIKKIEWFIQDYKNVKLILTSRPSCLKIQEENGFAVDGIAVQKYFLKALTDSEQREQIINIAETALHGFNTEQFWHDLKQFERNNRVAFDMGKNPLLLSIMVSVYYEDSVDGGKSGRFPESRIELYERAVNVLIKNSYSRQTEPLPQELLPYITTLLGRTALTAYEEAWRNKNTESMSRKIIVSDLKSYLLSVLKCTLEVAEHLSCVFLDFVEKRSIFKNNSFPHETFKEYLAAVYLCNNFFNSNANAQNLFEQIESLYFHENSHSVIELLLCCLDRETPHNETTIKLITKRMLYGLSAAPDYDLLCGIAVRLVNHRAAMSVELIVSMFERGCEGAVHPFNELFWYLSGRHPGTGLLDCNSEALENAYDIIREKYANDSQKINMASEWYHLYGYLYLGHEQSLLQYENNFAVCGDKCAFVWCKNWFNISGDGNLLYIDENMTYMPDHTDFSMVQYARQIKIHPRNKYYATDGEALYSIDMTVLFMHVRGFGDYKRKFIIPDTVVTIAESALSGCYDLEDVIIPDSVTYIKESAFQFCLNLRKIDVPDSVSEIGRYAFSHCESLTEIKLSKSLTIIDSGTFQGCKDLRVIEIPKSVSKIRPLAFDGCDNIPQFPYFSLSNPNAIIDTILQE